MKKRKGIVLFLVAVMMTNSFISPVLAEDGTGENEDISGVLTINEDVMEDPTTFSVEESATVSEDENTFSVSTYEELVAAVTTINANTTTAYRVEITDDIALMDHVEISGIATFVASGGDYTVSIGTGTNDAGTTATSNTKRFKLMYDAVVSFGEEGATNTLTITLGDGGSSYAIVSGFPYGDTSGKSTLNLYDGVCVTGKSGVGGVSYATINMYDGAEIKNNTVSQRGSGVYLDANAVFNMYGGEISGNKTTGSYNAGAIYAQDNCVINIFGGVISDNTAAGNGGAFYLNSSGTKLNISGGTITGNAAGSSYNGDVIYLNNSGATVMISGSPTISATDSDTDHEKMYYLNSSGSITYSDLTSGASIDVPSSFTLAMAEETFETYKTYFNAPEGYYAYYDSGMLKLTNSGYTVTYNANGGTGDTIDSDSYEYTETAIVATNTFTAPTDKEFNHWNTSDDGNGTAYSEGSSITITENVILYAIWSDPTYAVDFVVDGTTYSVKVVQGEAISGSLIPASNKTGYEVTGWYENENYSESAVDLTEAITGNTTLYAKLDPITYTLSFDESDTLLDVTYDSAIGTLPTPTKENYVFSHWTIDGTTITKDTIWEYDDDKKAIAVWDLATVQIVDTEQELRDAVAATNVTDIVVAGDITITSDVTFDRAVTLYSNGDFTIDTEGSNFRFYVSAENVNFGESTSSETNPASHTLTLCLGGSLAGIALNNASSVLNLYDGILISGLDGSRGIALTSSGAKFNMYGGEISDITTSTLGAGVYLYAEGTTFNMYDGIIQGNTATGKYGGGVYITGTDSTFNMYGGTITGNSANNGGGVYGNSNTNINIYKGTITDNKATSGSGGGIYANSGGTFSLTDSTITGNTSTSTGGGIYIYNSTAEKTAVITGNTITGNSSSSNSGGGIYFNGTTTMTISDNTITDNEANNGGGVFVNSASTVTMDNNTITNNNARSGSGGGIYFNSTATVTMSGNTINDNEANNGGGMYVNGATITLANKTIDSNEARSGSGGGIYITNSASNVTVTGGTIDSNTATSNGGGVYINNSAGAVLTVEDISITNNEANNGGGIYGHTNATVHVDTAIITSNKALSGSGGGIYANTGSGTFSLVDSTITYNTSTSNGGGVYAANSNGDTVIDISRNTISNNSSSGGSGGGLYFSGSSSVTVTVNMDDNTIMDNTAGSGTSHHGGGMYINEATVVITSSAINNNTVTGNGGGIYITGSASNVTIENSIASTSTFSTTETTTVTTINNNSAVNGGGVYLNSNSTFTLSDGSIMYNKASSVGGGVFANNSQFIMDGGQVSKNEAGGNGGGIVGGNASTLTLNNGTVYNNDSNALGDAIRVSGTTSIIISENTLIYDNDSSDDNNLISIDTTGEVSINATLTFDANGGSGTINNPIMNEASNGDVVYTTVLPDSEVSPPEQTGEYEMAFGGWNTESDGSGENYLPGDTIEYYASVTLYANWKEAKEYDLSTEIIYPDGSVEQNVIKVIFGSAITLDEPTFDDDDALFKGFYIDGKEIKNGDIWSYDEDQTAISKWNLWYVYDNQNEGNLINTYNLQETIDKAEFGDIIKIKNDLTLPTSTTFKVNSNERAYSIKVDKGLTIIGEKDNSDEMPKLTFEIEQESSNNLYNMFYITAYGEMVIFDYLEFSVNETASNEIQTFFAGDQSGITNDQNLLTIQNCIINSSSDTVTRHFGTENSAYVQEFYFYNNIVNGEADIVLWILPTSTGEVVISNNNFNGEGSDALDIHLFQEANDEINIEISSNVFENYDAALDITGGTNSLNNYKRYAGNWTIKYNIFQDVKWAIEIYDENENHTDIDLSYNYYETTTGRYSNENNNIFVDEQNRTGYRTAIATMTINSFLGYTFASYSAYSYNTNPNDLVFTNYYTQATIPTIEVDNTNTYLIGFSTDFNDDIEGEYITDDYYYIINGEKVVPEDGKIKILDEWRATSITIKKISLNTSLPISNVLDSKTQTLYIELAFDVPSTGVVVDILLWVATTCIALILLVLRKKRQYCKGGVNNRR